MAAFSNGGQAVRGAAAGVLHTYAERYSRALSEATAPLQQPMLHLHRQRGETL
jgi:hypothetical protein